MALGTLISCDSVLSQCIGVINWVRGKRD